MAIKEWSTTYKGASPVQDADPITGSMPDLDDETAEGADDGDEARTTQVEEPRDKLQAVAKLLGDSANAPVGSIAEILDRDHTNGDAQWLRLRERASAPTAVANKAFLYPLDDGGVTKLYVRWSDGTEVLLGSVADDSVTNAKLANMAQATIKGRASGAGTGDPSDLTAAQATAILDAFTDSLKGLAPASGGGTTNFLRADGTWAAPAGGGGGGGFDHEKVFTAASAGQETFNLVDTVATNANTPSGYSIRVFVNGNRHQYSASPGIREFDMPSATQVRVGGLNISDEVQVDYGV